jgi:hypothetical protein
MRPVIIAVVLVLGFLSPAAAAKLPSAKVMPCGLKTGATIKQVKKKCRDLRLINGTGFSTRCNKKLFPHADRRNLYFLFTDGRLSGASGSAKYSSQRLAKKDFATLLKRVSRRISEKPAYKWARGVWSSVILTLKTPRAVMIPAEINALFLGKK